MHNRSAVVIVATGASHRMREHDKLWTLLAGRITLARTVDVFEIAPLIDTIILITTTERLTDAHALCEHERWHKVAAVVPAGARRQDSVRIGLDILAQIAPTCHWVMIHDGARPFVSASLLEIGLRAAQEHQAVTAAVPVKETVKLVQHGHIQQTLDRSQLWTIQTPQIFSFPLLYQAHHSPAAQEDATDDATLVARMGQHVTIFHGSYANIKITTQEDVLLAEALIQGSAIV